MELEIYTGQLTYKDIDFMFAFDGKELRLIPPKTEKEKIHQEWIMKPIGKGVYTMGEPLKMELPYLIGKCNENGHTMIFITRESTNISSSNSVLFVEIMAYIDCKLVNAK